MITGRASGDCGFGRVVLLVSFLGAACGDPPLIPDDPDPRVPDPDPRVPPEPDPPEPGFHDEAPEIELWYGSDQLLGRPGGGVPQRWVNVLGRITEPSAQGSVYRLNGGPEVVFPRGRDFARLLADGDFNLELDRTELFDWPEPNVVDISVETAAGELLRRRLTLRVHPGGQPAPQEIVDFTSLEDIQELQQVASVVDGLWELTPEGLRTTKVGYDRLLALGSQTWRGNYEVRAEFILHALHAWGGVGVAVGWKGHAGTQSPRQDWPLEALGWVRNMVPQPELQLKTFGRGVLTHMDFELEPDVHHVLKIRTERTGDGPEVSLTVWSKSEEEPSEPQLTARAPEHDGSVLLVAHHVDLTWVAVHVTPLP